MGHPFKKICIPSNGLITRSIETSSRSNDLLTPAFGKSIHPFERLTHPFVKNIQPFERLAHPFAGTSIRSNDLSMRQSYERLSHPVRVLACSWWCLLRKKALRSLEQSATRLRHNHKISPNNVARKETVHVEKSNYSVVSLGSKGFCFWMPIQKYCSCVICERRQLSFKAHSEPLRE